MSTWGISTGHSNILAHDPTPIDNSVSQVSPHIPYEPSTGAPRRAFGRSQGFTRGGVPDPQAPVSVAKSRHEAARKVGISQPQNPGHAQSAADFFGGKHSTQYQRNSDARGVQARFMDPEVYQEQRRIEARQKEEFGRIAVTHQQELRSKREHERAEEQRANLAHIQAEQPWGKVGSGAPKLAIDGGRRALPTEVAKGTVFNEGGEDSFVGLNMGKNGSGAPLRQKDGSINARHKQIMSTFSHHLEGPDDAWAARHMGKEAPGAGPKVSEDGQILARKNCVVSKHRIHAEASEPTYHDQIFGKPAMGVRPNDQGRLGRTFDVTQHRIHKDAEGDHLAGFPNSYPQQRTPVRVSLDRQLQRQQQTVDPDPVGFGHGYGSGPNRTRSGRVNARRAGSTERDEEFSVRLGMPVTDRGYREPPPRSTYQYKPRRHQQQHQEQQHQQQQQQHHQVEVPFTSPLQDAASARSRNPPREPSTSEFIVDPGHPSRFEGGQ